MFLHVFDLFGCLPEEEVGTNGGAEDADDHGSGGRIWCELWPDRPQRHLAPRDMNREQYRCVSQQREGQPLQVDDVAVIGDENLQEQRPEHEEQRHEMAIEASDEFPDFPHSSDVRSNVERIGD